MPKPTKRRLIGLCAAVAVAAVVVLALRWYARPATPRVLVVGLDGADWQLLDAYRAKGSMPELDRLVREGRSGPLRSLVPPLSPLIWTTIATGVSPLRHRILDFTRFNPVTGQREPITSDDRRVKAVWEMASESGRDVAVFGLWATHPAEPVRGLMVSDRLFSFQRQEQAPAGVVYPPSEADRVLAARSAAEAAVSLPAMRSYLPWLAAADYEALLARPDQHAHPVTALRRILVETRLYDQLARDWLRRTQPSLSFVYLQGTDMIGHVFSPYAPPRLASVTAEDFDRYHGVPEAYFREVDGILGAYRKIAEESGSVLLVVSDHGFLWSEGRPPRPDSLATATAGLWHRQEGIYLLWGRGIAPSSTRTEGRVGQVTATILALLGLPRAADIEGPALPGVTESDRTRDYGVRAAAAAATGSGGEAPAAAGPPTGEALEKLRALGYLGTAESASRPAGAADQTRTAGSYNNEGLLLKDAGRPSDARRAFEEALRVEPRAASAAHNLSVLLGPEEADRSDQLMLDALANGLGDGVRIVASAALTYANEGNPRRARRLMEGAVRRVPEDALLRYHRGRMRLEGRECAPALEDFAKLRELTPTVAVVHGLYGTALLCLGRPAEARAAFQRSLELDPSQVRLREQLDRLR
ncbi:MAG: alkaline phosphatase family protein [Vicinamibacteria bacterium]